MSRLQTVREGKAEASYVADRAPFWALIATCHWLEQGELILDSEAEELLEDLNQCLE